MILSASGLPHPIDEIGLGIDVKIGLPRHLCLSLYHGLVE